MHPEMSEKTRQEVLSRMRYRYRGAGLEYKTRLIDEAVELFGYHRKAAIRALRRTERELVSVYVIGRPREYKPEQMLKPLKAIWLTALQPCGKRLVALMPRWIQAYEEDHQKLIGGGAARVPARCCDRRFPFARSGTMKVPVIWRWTRWRCVVALWMTGTSGCLTAWTFARPGWKSER
jgi:hypothetical protein